MLNLVVFKRAVDEQPEDPPPEDPPPDPPPEEPGWSTYWQEEAPEDAAGSSNTVSMMWTGAPSASGITFSARCSAAASKVRAVVTQDSTFATGLLYSKNPVATTDGIAKATVQGLSAGTLYYYRLMVDGVLKTTPTGRFRTLPTAEDYSLKIVLGSCSNNQSDAAFNAMRARSPDLFIQMGDIHYHNVNSLTEANYQNAYNSLFSNSNIGLFYRQVPTLTVWSDHDFCGEPGDRTQTGKPTVQAVYRKRVPHAPLVDSAGIYHAVEAGRLVIVMTDCRSFRDPTGTAAGPSKTVLGATQKQWLKDLLTNQAYNDRLFVLVFPEPWIGSGGDTWGTYTHERAEIADYITANDLASRVCMLSGDQHCIAIDNGSHVPGGFPLFHAAPLSSGNTTKGGTYTYGPFATADQQYGVMDVDDDGETISVTWTAYTAAGSLLATYAFDVAP